MIPAGPALGEWHTRTRSAQPAGSPRTPAHGHDAPGANEMHSFATLLAGILAAFGSFAVEELTDQVFQHDGRLGGFDRVALHQVGLAVTGLQANVLLAQQT